MSYHKYYEDDPEWEAVKKKSEIEFNRKYEISVRDYKEHIKNNPSALEALRIVVKNMPFGMRLTDFLKEVENDG